MGNMSFSEDGGRSIQLSGGICCFFWIPTNQRLDPPKKIGLTLVFRFGSFLDLQTKNQPVLDFFVMFPTCLEQEFCEKNQTKPVFSTLRTRDNLRSQWLQVMVRGRGAVPMSELRVGDLRLGSYSGDPHRMAWVENPVTSMERNTLDLQYYFQPGFQSRIKGFRLGFRTKNCNKPLWWLKSWVGGVVDLRNTLPETNSKFTSEIQWFVQMTFPQPGEADGKLGYNRMPVTIRMTLHV